MRKDKNGSMAYFLAYSVFHDCLILLRLVSQLICKLSPIVDSL